MIEDDIKMSESSSSSRPSTPIKVEDFEHGSPLTTPEPIICTPNRKLSGDALEVVSRLDNYIPLGTLCFENHGDVTKHTLGTCSEVSRLPPSEVGETISNLSKLLENGWIRLQSTSCFDGQRKLLIYRIWVLQSDVGQGCIDRSRRQLRNALEVVLRDIDVSPASWDGQYRGDSELRFDPWAARDEDDPSLFYAFNKIQSPSPSASDIEETYSHEALKDLLDGSGPIGLQTNLYPYQRRSAGEMLHRELVPRSMLDPRFESRSSPDGSVYYFNAREVKFVRRPADFEACRGGILAETMGNGKTVICLALILTTKNLPPKIPVNYAAPTRRSKVGSLAQMAASSINQNSFPWRVEMDRIQQATGASLDSCVRRLTENPGFYDVPVVPYRFNRNTRSMPPHRMTLASTTLIVVPPNLCKQWQSEITKHVEAGALNVLVMDNRKKVLPAPSELRSYDIILFTRNRFDMESKHGEDADGRRLQKAPVTCQCPYIGATRKRDCTCLREDNIYDSPLRHVHFKRLVVDEGHFFSSSRTNTALVARTLVTADHRWIVSGTPAQDLLGAEVHLSAKSDVDADQSLEDLIKQQRFFGNRDKVGAIDSLGSLITSFLGVEPWSSSGNAAWKEYIFCHRDRRHTYSGFSACLQKTLHDTVVKTQPKDVERDIELPPLNHTIVRLEPSFYDKLTSNLFTTVLTSNAVTSERTDADYLFHKNSTQARTRLITNLRQSAFFWTGFSELDVNASLKVGNGYLEKEDTQCTIEDRQLLSEALSCLKDAVLGSAGWRSMSRSQELGVFVEDWPADCAEHWTFDGSTQPLLIGITQLAQAQKFVDGRLGEDDPGEGLSGTGIKALASTRFAPQEKDGEMDGKAKAAKPAVTKSGIPASSIESLDGAPTSRKKKASNTGFPKTVSKSFRITKARKDSPTKPPPQSARSRLSSGSPYSQARIVGTASAKLSYLISQITKYCEDEKILVFYQGDHIAYYISQLLDLLQIQHEIYAKSLDARLKSEYVVSFNNQEKVRVLLMDVRQAAYGLNLCSASRIYFVNPVCRPNDEAQAIKRAHRIGQTRPVFVETLVLKGSMEEKMLERSKQMTTDEHRDAKTLEDDWRIREIIQSARILPVTEAEKSANGQMAPIEHPEPLWDRSGRLEYNARDDMQEASRKRKRDITMNDVTDPNFEGRVILEDEDEPASKRRATVERGVRLETPPFTIV